MNKFKKIPTFKNEDDERKFWESADSTEYLDWSKAQKLSLPNLKRGVNKSLPKASASDVKDCDKTQE